MTVAAGGMIRALGRLDRRGIRLTQWHLALGLIACMLLGVVVIADGFMVTRREALEHEAFSDGWSVADRPSHRPSALLLLGVLAGVVLLRGLISIGKHVAVPGAHVAWVPSYRARPDFSELRLHSRAPPAWSHH